jgi:hypothetical protein
MLAPSSAVGKPGCHGAASMSNPTMDAAAPAIITPGPRHRPSRCCAPSERADGGQRTAGLLRPADDREDNVVGLVGRLAEHSGHRLFDTDDGYEPYDPDSTSP